MSERRIEELEIKLAYQEQALQELDAVVLSQSRQIDALQARLRRISERLEGLVSPGDEPPDAEIPPHY